MPTDPYDINSQDPYPMYNVGGVDPDEERKKWATEALDSPNGVLPFNASQADVQAAQKAALANGQSRAMQIFNKLRGMGKVFDPGMTGNAGQNPQQQPQQQQLMSPQQQQGYDPYSPYNQGQQLSKAVSGLYNAFSGGS